MPRVTMRCATRALRRRGPYSNHSCSLLFLRGGRGDVRLGVEFRSKTHRTTKDFMIKHIFLTKIKKNGG